MSNIQKNFKMKSQLRGMADGGVVDHMSGKSREQQLKEASGEWKPAAAPKAGQPDFRNVQAKVTSSYDEKKKSALQRLFGIKDGGTPPTRRGKGTVDNYPATEYDFHGGSVEGPGGPTDDKVGPVKLSNKEYVLPADTVAAIGVDKLEALRAATHDFDSTEDAEGLAGGGIMDWIKNTAGAVASKLRGAAAPASAPTAPVTPAASAAPIRPAFAPGGTQVMGEAGRASARAAAYEAAGNPLGAARVGAAAPSAAPGVATVAENAAAKTGLVSRAGGLRAGLGSVLRGAGVIGTASAPVSGFGDYKADTGGIDTSAGGTVGYLGRGEFGKAGLSLSGGLAEAAADATRGVAKTVDGITGLFGANADFTGAVDRTLADKTGGYLSLRKPDFSNVQGGVKSTEDMIGGPVGTPSATPVRDVMGSPAMANESGGRTPPPTTYKGDDSVLRGAGGYQGLLENRSGLKNSDPRINGSTSEAYNAMSDNAVIGSYNGKPMTKKEADARAAGLQTASGYDMSGKQSDPMMDVLKSALRGGGGGGYSAPSSNARDINARFDALSKDLEGRYGSKGQGNLAKRKLELEGMRASALDADARNMSSLRGQDMQASSNAEQRRMDAARIAAGLMADRQKTDAAGQAAATKAQQDAMKAAAEANQQGYENFTKATDSMFVGPEGKPDPAMREQFMDFVSATDPKFLEENVGVRSVKDLFALTPQEQMTATQKLKTMMQMQQAANASRAEGMFNSGMASTGFEAPVGDPREYSLRDVASGNLSPSRYAYNFINPFADDRVQELEGGAVVPYDDYVGKSADREKARKSNLRNP